MVAKPLNWNDIADRLDYDKLYDALGWEPISSQGNEDRGYCLLPQNHANGDTSGKLAINRDKSVYNCWVCGGGTILTLVMEVKGLRYNEALHYLSGFVDDPNRESTSDFESRIARLLEPEQKQVKKSLPVFQESVVSQWDRPHEWFTERHISDDTRRLFKAGFDPVARRYTPKEGAYQGPAIILPHYWDGRLVGWQSRWLASDRPEWVQKYTNTTDFPRERTVWGLHAASKSDSPPILCESVATALYCYSEGHSAIATFGAQSTDEQIRHIRGFQQGVILAPDNDQAGRNWLVANINRLERFIPVMVAPFVDGEGADIGDLNPEELSLHLENIQYAQEISEG